MGTECIRRTRRSRVRGLRSKNSTLDEAAILQLFYSDRAINDLFPSPSRTPNPNVTRSSCKQAHRPLSRFSSPTPAPSLVSHRSCDSRATSRSRSSPKPMDLRRYAMLNSLEIAERANRPNYEAQCVLAQSPVCCGATPLLQGCPSREGGADAQGCTASRPPFSLESLPLSEPRPAAQKQLVFQPMQEGTLALPIQGEDHRRARLQRPVGRLPVPVLRRSHSSPASQISHPVSFTNRVLERHLSAFSDSTAYGTLELLGSTPGKGRVMSLLMSRLALQKSASADDLPAATPISSQLEFNVLLR